MIIPFGEWTPDVAAYRSSAIATLSGAVPRGDGYGPFPSLSAYSAALPGTCRGFFKAIKTDGSVAIFAATATRLYALNNTNQAWTDVSLGGGRGIGYAALSSTDQWQLAQFGNFVIAVQANVAPQYFDLTASTAFANLAGSPPQARYIAIVGYFVVLSGLVNNPYRIQWSALGDATGWTPGLNSSSYQDFPDGGIVRGVAGGEFGNIFQDTAIRRLVYAPGSPVIFQIERISDDRGLYAPYSRSARAARYSSSGRRASCRWIRPGPRSTSARRRSIVRSWPISTPATCSCCSAPRIRGIRACSGPTSRSAAPPACSTS